MGGALPPAERRSSVLLVLYVALSLLLLMIGDRLPQAALRGIGATLFAPLDHVVLSIDRVAAAWRENQTLHVRLTALELENVRLRRAAIENQELRRQLDLPGYRDPGLKPVEVLALAGEPIPGAATLSAGHDRGVHIGD